MPTVKEGVPQACGILNVSYGKWLQSFVNCIHSLKVGLVKAVAIAVIPVLSCSSLQCYYNASVVVFCHIVLGQGCCGERLFFAFFQCAVSCVLSIPKTIRNS